MTNLRSIKYINDYKKFYGGTLVQYIGNENGFLKRNVTYTVDSFIDNSDKTVYIRGVGNVRGRFLISLNLPNGRKSCYIPANNFKKV
tara:strand:- start:1987 stop:2247 length:261 start_codon:yes stop_codon:yes gene_type:complete